MCTLEFGQKMVLVSFPVSTMYTNKTLSNTAYAERKLHTKNRKLERLKIELKFIVRVKWAW